AHRDAQTAHVGDFAVEADALGLRGRLDRRQRRAVPDHGQGAVLGMEREGDLPLDRELVHRRALGRFDPVVGDVRRTRLRLDLWIVRVEEETELGLVQVGLALDRGGLTDPIGVVEHDTEVADATDAGLRAHRGQAGFDARIAEDALLRLAALPVVVDLLVGTAGQTHAPATALVLVDEDDAILLAFVDRPRRTRRDAGRIQAVFAEAGQVHHERVL